MEIKSAALRKTLEHSATPFKRRAAIDIVTGSVLPVRGFLKGMVPMVILVFHRILLMIGLLVLPIHQTVLMICILVTVHFFIFPVPDGMPGIVVAQPLTQLQDRVVQMIKRFADYRHPVWCLDNHWSTVVPLVMFVHPEKHLLRQHLTAHDGSTLGLDWYIPSVSDVLGILLVIPGLNGSSQGGYTVDLMHRVGFHGFASAVLNGRGAGSSDVEAVEHAFHLGRSADLMDALKAIERMQHSLSTSVPVYIVGFSAGGIRAVKFASVYGKSLKNRVSGILSFGGCVRNQNTHQLRTSTHVYQPVIAFRYADVMYKKLSEISSSNSDLLSLFTSGHFETFRDFDRRVTAVLHNTSLEEYERSVFAYHDEHWREIAVPTLIVNAIDDPVLHIEDAVIPEMALGNSNIFFLKTKQGGHLGWPVGASTQRDGYRWMSDVTISFIRAIAGV
jgi:predicted alpha/beta-fold hydrolase